jgi:glycosyltransferase involved in cell wall biosynthesis
MKKVNILHVAATTTGGVGLNILLLAKYLNKERFAISVAVALGSPLDEEFRKQGVEIYPIHMSREPHCLRNIVGLYELWKLIGSKKFAIVHTHTSVGGALGRIAAKARRVPIVLWTIHGWAFNYPMGILSQRVFRLIERFLDYFTDHYVAVSRDMREVGIQAGVTIPEKVSIIYHGIESEPWNTPKHDDNLREVWGIGEDIFSVVGNIARLEPQKAIDDFLKAARIVKEQIPNVKFLVVGDGPLRAHMERLAAQLGIADNVFFTGWQKDVPAYLDMFDVLCISSRWEGFPFLLLEAMTSKTPVVATRGGGIPEMVEDGKTGLLVPPASPAALAQGIIKLITNKGRAQEMGEASKKRVQQQFSIAQMINQYEKLYLRLLEKE